MACDMGGSWGRCHAVRAKTFFMSVTLSATASFDWSNCEFSGSKPTATTPLCFRVSRVTHAEPRSDFRTHHRSKIARKTCALLIAFPAPRFRRPSGVGSPPNAPEAGRQSRTRLGAVLVYWCMTQRHAGARATPRPRAGAFRCRGLRHCNMGAEYCTALRSGRRRGIKQRRQIGA
jgi:hypothetical protein